MGGINQKTEFKCEVCKANAEIQGATKGEDVFNKSEVCINMSGMRDNSRTFSNLIPELAGFPLKELCHSHMVAQRVLDGGDWTTVTNAAKRVAQQKKKNHDFDLPVGKVEEPSLLAKIRRRYGGQK